MNDGAARVVRLGAYALCFDRAGRILLCRIAPGYPATGTWTLPGGGVEFGEEPNRAVIRELAEETGLEGAIDGLVAVYSRRYPPAETQSGNDLHFVGIVYRVTTSSEAIRVEVGGSTDDVAWFDAAALADAPVADLARFGLTLTGLGAA